MKDDRGLYYHPSLQNHDTRMYVRDSMGRIEFRLWNREDPGIWERHGWLSLEIVKAAAEMFRERGADRNPLALYDLDVARRLIKDGE
ncbi:MAG: hypothetical protein AB7D51_14900 [Desulfovibrionaceae bacterium]|jgi:hypothetical protein|nr:hypothetical protein [Desulfovibrionaceae bacterium]